MDDRKRQPPRQSAPPGFAVILKHHPDLQRRVFCDAAEIAVGRQHGQVVAQAELRQQGIHRSDLHALATAMVPQRRGLNVILTIRHDQRQGRKPRDDLIPAPGTGKTLQQFLQHEASGEQRLAGFERPDQHTDFRNPVRLVAPQRERPDAGVHKETHARLRSAL
jgi:hypothetical protein